MNSLPEQVTPESICRQPSVCPDAVDIRMLDTKITRFWEKGHGHQWTYWADFWLTIQSDMNHEK